MWSSFLLQVEVTGSPTWKHWWWTLHKLWLWKLKKKSFFIPFNHWEGKAVVRADMTNVWQACFSCVKSGGTEIIYGAREDKETFPHKKVLGRCPQIPEWEPVTGWHDVVGNCWAESAFSQKLLHVWSGFSPPFLLQPISHEWKHDILTCWTGFNFFCCFSD